MLRPSLLAAALLAVAPLAMTPVAVTPLAQAVGGEDPEIRFSTFNASLNRTAAGHLVRDLSTPSNVQAQNVAETIQRVRPDVLLINEFDYAPEAVDLFRDNYLEVSHHGSEPIDYPYAYIAPSNTGVASGFDLNNDNRLGGPSPRDYGNDSWGYGEFVGQFGMVVYSKYPIDTDSIRTFRDFKWADMPGALLPDNPATAAPADWYSPAELDRFPLSSKSHWDVPIMIGKKTVHFLVSHPTPPVFDGPEDRNGTRNHDEIRFWADYIDRNPRRSAYIYDDSGVRGGLAPSEQFVIAGDLNSDPLDGDSIVGSAQQLLDHKRIGSAIAPSSDGGPWAAAKQGQANLVHESDPAFDTADFDDRLCCGPGNLRADYVLPSKAMTVVGSGIFWPKGRNLATGAPADEFFYLTGDFPFVPTSDHRQVWVDVRY